MHKRKDPYRRLSGDGSAPRSALPEAVVLCQGLIYELTSTPPVSKECPCSGMALQPDGAVSRLGSLLATGPQCYQ